MKSLVSFIEQLIDERQSDTRALVSETGEVVLIGDYSASVGDVFNRIRPAVRCEVMSFGQAEAVFVDSASTVLDGCRRWTVALVIQEDSGVTPGLPDKELVKTILCRLRDLHADKVLHVVISAAKSLAGWTLADSLEMGFSVLHKNITDKDTVYVYQFSVCDYKSTPDWLNARHWAHPHLWS